MWILVIFCMIIIIVIWKINFDLNKSNKINPINNSNNLDLPPFPKIEEFNKGIDSIEKFNGEELEEELLEENKEEME